MEKGKMTATDDNIILLDALLREDLRSFIQKGFYTIAAGQTFLPNWHLDVIAWHLTEVYRGKIKRLIITLPPRHLKSICASSAFPAWVLGHDPTSRIVSVSHSADLAAKHARDCRLVMMSPWYRRIFPKTRLDPKKNTETEFATTRRGYRYSTSIGGPLTGRGGNLIIVDDPHKAEEPRSDPKREAVTEFYDTTLYSRLDNKAQDRIIVIMQRLHTDDLVGHILGQEEWVHVNIPAIAENRQSYQCGPNEFIVREPGELLHPERETREILDQIKERIGSYNFAAQYQQGPEPPGGNMIKRDWLQFYKELPTKGEYDQIIQSWDTASKANELCDYSVCTTWWQQGKFIYLIDVVRERFEYPDLRRRVIEEAEKYNPNAILIEDKGSGTHIIQKLYHESRFNAIAITPETDKETRMAAQTAKIEAGSVLLPEQAPWLGDFLTELLLFPNGRHDDQVDSVSQAIHWITGPRSEPGIRFL
jgi:predicted phage terminase large subunit-like protein